MGETNRLRVEVEELKGGMYALIDALDRLAERLDTNEEKLKFLLSSANFLKLRSAKTLKSDPEGDEI